MLYIYTENFFWPARAKNAIKKILGRYSRGPEAVEISLFGGLSKLNKEFLLNGRSENIQTACVLSGPLTLKWAISQKQKGVIKNLIAGPNVVVNPRQKNSLLAHPLIDKILVPSKWVKDFYVALAPEILNKVFVWPAGVLVPDLADNKKTLDFIVYSKSSNKLLNSVVNHLLNQGYSFKILTYGKFSQKDYFNLLQKAKGEIYLSDSESQGLAMFEAWARGVPTLVWEKGSYEAQGVRIEGSVSAPYLNKEAGSSFKSLDELTKVLPEFIKGSFAPRRYVESNFSPKKIAQNFINIVYADKNS